MATKFPAPRRHVAIVKSWMPREWTFCQMRWENPRRPDRYLVLWYQVGGKNHELKLSRWHTVLKSQMRKVAHKWQPAWYGAALGGHYIGLRMTEPSFAEAIMPIRYVDPTMQRNVELAQAERKRKNKLKQEQIAAERKAAELKLAKHRDRMLEKLDTGTFDFGPLRTDVVAQRFLF